MTGTHSKKIVEPLIVVRRRLGNAAHCVQPRPCSILACRMRAKLEIGLEPPAGFSNEYDDSCEMGPKASIPNRLTVVCDRVSSGLALPLTISEQHERKGV